MPCRTKPAALASFAGPGLQDDPFGEHTEDVEIEARYAGRAVQVLRRGCHESTCGAPSGLLPPSAHLLQAPASLHRPSTHHRPALRRAAAPVCSLIGTLDYLTADWVPCGFFVHSASQSIQLVTELSIDVTSLWGRAVGTARALQAHLDM